MNKAHVLAAAAVLAVGSAAHADITVTPAIVSDYDFRGITQTQEDPALQLGLDYSFNSGFHVNAWASNVDYGRGDPDVKVDFGAGFSGGDAAGGLAYDLGVVSYLYPGASSINTVEAYAGITRGLFGAKLWYSPDYNGAHASAYYLEGNVSVPLTQTFFLRGHAGWSDGDAWRYVGGYYDWSMGVEWTAGNVTLGLRYVDGDHDVVKGRVIGAFSVQLPWSAQ
ncbi:MAG: TorF family putative porin [Steroidobacteraceae bacterium]